VAIYHPPADVVTMMQRRPPATRAPLAESNRPFAAFF